MADKVANILGKDWFTIDEAAFYCGVSISHFKAREPDYALLPRRFMGKKLYEGAALYEAISKSAPWHLQPGPSAFTLAPCKNLSPVRRRPYRPRKAKRADDS